MECHHPNIRRACCHPQNAPPASPFPVLRSPMSHSLRLHLAALVCALGTFTATTASGAEKLREGDALPAFTLKDQHERPYTSDASLRLVVIAFAMDPAKTANAFLARQPTAFLDEHHAVFISDIHSMPRFVRGFVVPKLRQHPHRILLAETAETLARYPEAPDKLTVLRLDDRGRIAAILFVDPTKELAGIFRAPTP